MKRPRNYFLVFYWCVALLLFLFIVRPGLAEEPGLVSTSSTEAGSTQVDSSQGQDSLTPIPEAQWWALRVENLKKAIKQGKSSETEANLMYLELKAVLTHQRAELLRALDNAETVNDLLEGALALQAPFLKQDQKLLERVTRIAKLEGYDLEPPDTVIELYNAVNTLYWSRVKLLGQVGLELWLQVTGTHLTGVGELKGELEQIHLRFELSQLKLATLARELPYYATRAPLLILARIINLSLEILLFIWWRRWAEAGLPKLVSKLMDIRPRRLITLRLARMVWYFNRVRAPLEWMFLTFAVFSTVDIRGFGISIFYEFGVIIFKWLFLGWLAAAAMNAVADRRAGRASAEAESLRIQSINLLAFWLVLFGLGRNLARNYAGEATLHEWVNMLFWLLLIFVGLLLLKWWRPEVQRQLKQEVQKPKWVTDVLATEKGFMSYPKALLGALYLALVKIQRRILATVNELEFGRRFLANFLYRETVRQYRLIEHEEGQPVSEKQRESLLDNTGAIYDGKYARSELNQLIGLIEQGAGGTIAIVGERGGGKTVFVKCAMEKSSLLFLMVDCPVGGDFAVYRRELVKLLGLPETEASIEAINKKIEDLSIKAIVIDNVHRLARPALGGQDELTKLADFTLKLSRDIFNIVLVDKYAWQYLRRVRAKRLILERVVNLPPWTVDELAELISFKTLAVGIAPNYSRFILPSLFDEAGLTTMEERQRYGFYRILWSASDGNPEISLRLYVKSLAVHDNGDIFVKMPIPPNIEQLDALDSEQLLVLRVIAQSGYATPEQVQECLALELNLVQEIFRLMQWRGWIESVNGYYRIKWTWYRAITRKLIRQNLLER